MATSTVNIFGYNITGLCQLNVTSPVISITRRTLYRVAQNKRPITFYVINVLVIDIFAWNFQR